MAKTSESPELLGDLSESGAAVTSRISDPEQALVIVKRLIADDRVRAARRTKVQGQIDGNAPVSLKKLQDAGREGDSNLNWREAKGHILNAWTPYFDLTIEVPVCIDADLEFASPDQDAELMRGFAEYFHDLVFGWKGFDRVQQMRDWQMLTHGPGILAWEDEWDWRSKPILVGDFYVPDETDSDLENCELAMITQERNAGQLYAKIADEKQAKAAGWFPDAVKRVIMESARANSPARQWKWEKWQQAFKNGDIYVSQKLTKRIQLATLYVKEMGGKISQHIIQYGAGGDVDFLFSKIDRYEDWDECLCLFPYDIGSDGSYHSVKGLGTEIFPYCELSNRLKNATADVVLTGIKPMFQATSGTAAEGLQMIKLGNGNVLPPNINFAKLDVSSSLEPALAVSREMATTLAQNTGTYRDGDVAAPTVDETAKAATIRAMDRSKLSKGAHNRFYRAKDREYTEYWRRATNPELKAHHPGAKEALAFQEKCYKLCDKFGVKHEALQAVQNIRAYRSMGLGSAAMRVEIAQAFLNPNFIDRLGEEGQNNVLRSYASALTSYAHIDAIVPSLTQGEIPTEDDSIATLENNAMNTGGEVLITPRQNHVIHLKRHVASMEQDERECQAGQQDPRICFQRLEAKGAHSYVHLAALQSNPTRQKEFKEFSARLAPLASFQDMLQQHIEEQDQSAPQSQEQPSPEMAKVQGTLQLKSIKQQGDHELKIEKTKADLALRAQKQQADIALAAHRTSADTSLADAETAAKIHRDNIAAQPNGNS